jgi:hypothetical protein
MKIKMRITKIIKIWNLEEDNNDNNNIRSVKSKEIDPKQQVPKGESIL